MQSLGYRYVDGFKVHIIQINDLVVGIATDIGPRILYLALKNELEMNILGIVPELSINTPEGVWRIFGGHRLWVAPEAMPRSYSLDDKPVDIEVKREEVVVRGNVEVNNMIRKEMVIKPGPTENSIEVVHRVLNIGRWDIEFACWALTVMKKNGFAIIPIKPRCVDERCLLPDRSIALWPYTKINDERLLLTNNYVIVKHSEKIREPIKIGVRAYPYWAAYYVDGYIFVKKFNVEEQSIYPDFNVYTEVYANDKILELETLGPLRKVPPGGINEHREIWFLNKIGLLKPEERDIEEKLKSIV